MKILITGAEGFIGKNLACGLRERGYEDLVLTDLDTPRDILENAAADCDFVFHLAGVNRPQQESEFLSGNRDALSELLSLLKAADNRCGVMLSSSTQALLDNPYGRSKRAAEELLFAYGKERGVPVYVFRFPNVFGKWSRPDYNSAVATFCYRVARGLPIAVNDPERELTLLYIDDLVAALCGALTGDVSRIGEICVAPAMMKTKLSQVAELISTFPDMRKQLLLPRADDPLEKKLYATYLSFLPETDFSYPLNTHSDARGSFTELLKTPAFGQVSVNVTKPGVTKGKHYHHTKNEKFIVVSGEGIIRFRRIDSDLVLEYPVSGERITAVDIPTGYTHSIENTGKTDLVTLMWASEPYDPEHPDT